jgi:serine/threonine protein kinase/ligand-binding sensor domain-containing protein
MFPGSLRVFLFVFLLVLAAPLAASGQTAPTSLPHPGVPDITAPAVSSLRFLPAAKVFTDQSGLPQNSLTAVVTDHDGFLWVGTQDGAARFDGRTWTTVNMPERITSNWIRAILVRKNGDLWFGTESGGIFVYSKGSFIAHYRKGSDNFPVNSVYDLVETEENGRTQIWAATFGGGLGKFEDEKWVFFNRQNSGLPDDGTRCLLATRDSDNTQIVWVGTLNGLARFQNGSWKIYGTAEGLPDPQVRCLYETESETGERILWIGMYKGGLGTLRHGVFRWEAATIGGASFIRTIYQTLGPQREKILWVGTNSGGLAFLQNGTWTIYNLASGVLPNNEVTCLLETKVGNGPQLLWVGTNSGGLARLRLGKWQRVVSPPDTIPLIGIKSLLETTGPDGRRTYWFGTRANGLGKLENDRWEVFAPEKGNFPHRLCGSLYRTKAVTGGEAIWAGTGGGGIVVFQNGKQTVYNKDQGQLPDNNVWAFLETTDSDGTPILWVGTEGGLVKFRNGTWTTFTTANSGLPHNYAAALAETIEPDGTKNLWVGTFGGGLAKLHNGSWEVLSVTRGTFPNNVVRALTMTTDKQGHRILWAGTYGGVVYRYLDGPERKWISISDTSTPALPNNVIYEIREDPQKRIYLFTNRGVVRLTADENGDWNVPLLEVFNIEEGLPSNECNGGAALSDSFGRIWTGTIAGLTVLDTTRESTVFNPGTPFIQKVSVNGTEITGNDLSLSHDQNNLIIEYMLLSYFRGEETRFSTQLVGYDPNPTPWGADTKRIFTNLPRGDYEFRVWSRDFNGNEKPAGVLRFRIHPAVWATWWAYMLYLIVLCAVAYGIFRWRLKVLEQRNLELEEKVLNRTTELAEKNEQLDRKISELNVKNNELNRKNNELAEAQRRTDLVFGALAEALPGTVLDNKYRLDLKIGAGGFGAVFEATQLNLNRKVAVKVFRPAAGNDSVEALERFRQEGISACRINHPNAVAILDSGVSTDGIAYLVMELLRGYSLADELHRRDRVSPRRCAEILIPVCEVLQIAHEEGIIHRDIKPDNIFLHQTKEGEVVKVVDFGVAKLMGESASVVNGTLSGVGSIVGTAFYLAPERINALPYDGKSDVYSLGVTLYQMLTGKLPFASGSTFISVALMHVTQAATPPRSMFIDIPVELDEIVMRALSKTPEDRPTARELAGLLEPFTLAERSQESLPVVTAPRTSGSHLIDTFSSAPTLIGSSGKKEVTDGKGGSL